MEFFASAVDTLKVLVMAIGCGLGAWGIVNLLEGYGADNPASKVTGSEAPVTSGIITRTEEDKIYDLTEEEVKIIADIIENGTWNTEGTAECANDCKLIIDERTYYYHSECGTFNDKENNQNLPVTAEEKESINAILAQYITLGLE